jgi:hypothetical protein
MAASAQPARPDALAPPPALVAGLVALACGWAIWLRWRVLASSPYPFGVDGYFYAIEVRSLLAGDGLAYPTAPLGPMWLAPFAWLVGDPIAGVKLGAAIGGGLAVVPGFALGRRLGGGVAAGLVAAALLATSPTAVYLTTEFVKQALGLTAALAALAALAAALERPRRTRVALAVAAVVATAACHKLALSLVVALAGPMGIAASAAWTPRARRVAVVVVAALAALALVAGLAMPARFLAPRDLALLGGVLGGFDPRLPVLEVGGRALGFHREVALAALLALGALLVWARRSARPPAPHAAALLAAAAALGLALAWPWLAVDDPGGLGFRLRLAASLPIALCGAALAGAARGRTAALVVVGVAAAIALVRPSRTPAAEITPHPAMVAAVAGLAAALPPDAVVITPERHLLFMAEWYGGGRVDARLGAGAEQPGRRWRLVPMA